MPQPAINSNNPGIGVLVTNLGTPDTPDSPALRRYLGEFLSDPRVVEIPRLLWWPILHGIILRLRPSRSAKAYQRIWTEEGSPLLVYSNAITSGIAGRLESRLGYKVPVALGMRYGKPAIESALTELLHVGAEKILVLPLYPQYAASTVASSFDAICRSLHKLRAIPALRFINHYYNASGYIDALGHSVERHWQQHGRGEKLLISFHGLPRSSVEAGDPYATQCDTTARLLAARLQITPADWQLVYQSRFGPAEWLQPYAEESLRELARNGVRRVDVICPGFAADCLETLEEIALRYAETFREAGGDSLNYIHALNDDSIHIDALADIVMTNLQGWFDAGQVP